MFPYSNAGILRNIRFYACPNAGWEVFDGFCVHTSMEETVFRCCKRKPLFFVQYSVAGFQKNYLVCSDCINLECFSKYIVKKIPISDTSGKNFQNEISDETVENEITDRKIDELIEQNEKLIEYDEKDSHSDRILKSKEGEKFWGKPTLKKQRTK